MRERIAHILALALLIILAASPRLFAADPAVPAVTTPPATAPSDAAATHSNTGAVVITVDGQIDDYTRDKMFRRFDQARALGAKSVILQINTYGGLVTAGLDMSRFLKAQNDLHVIAYVHDKAISAGAMIALACDEIVMSPSATIGDAAPISISASGQLQGLGAAERAKAESPILADFRESAERHGYSPLLAEAMVAVGRVVYWVEGPAGERQFVGEREYNKLTGEGWKAVAGAPSPVDSAETLLTVHTALATKLGLAKGQATTAETLAAERGLQIAADLSPGGGEKFIELLGGGIARTVLLVVFLLSLYIAMHTPGHGMAEAVAAISLCVLVGVPLLTGYAQWWEIIAIFVGMILLALEIFVIPGFGFAGIAGTVLLLGGLIMTFVGNGPGMPGIWKLPSIQQGLRTGLTSVIVGLLCSLVLAAWLRRYLPKIPFFNRLILTATSGGTTDPRPAGVALQDPNDVWPFAGTVGVATTDLKPGGEAQFPYADDRRATSVVSDSGYVEAGTKIVVREARRFRVVVRPVA